MKNLSEQLLLDLDVANGDSVLGDVARAGACHQVGMHVSRTEREREAIDENIGTFTHERFPSKMAQVTREQEQPCSSSHGRNTNQTDIYAHLLTSSVLDGEDSAVLHEGGGVSIPVLVVELTGQVSQRAAGNATE